IECARSPVAEIGAYHLPGTDVVSCADDIFKRVGRTLGLKRVSILHLAELFIAAEGQLSRAKWRCELSPSAPDGERKKVGGRGGRRTVEADRRSVEHASGCGEGRCSELTGGCDRRIACILPLLSYTRGQGRRLKVSTFGTRPGAGEMT